MDQGNFGSSIEVDDGAAQRLAALRQEWRSASHYSDVAFGPKAVGLF